MRNVDTRKKTKIEITNDAKLRRELAALDNLIGLVTESFGDDREAMRDVDTVIAFRNRFWKNAHRYP